MERERESDIAKVFTSMLAYVRMWVNAGNLEKSEI